MPAYILEVALINQLHLDENVQEQLGFRNEHHCFASRFRAVHDILNTCSKASDDWSRLGGELQTIVEIGQVKFESKEGVCKSERLA